MGTRQDVLILGSGPVTETYEFFEAAEEDDTRAMCEELGDLLLQVVLHAQIALELGKVLLRLGRVSDAAAADTAFVLSRIRQVTAHQHIGRC